jgi:hypothetical protein
VLQAGDLSPLLTAFFGLRECAKSAAQLVNEKIGTRAVAILVEGEG